MKRKLIYIIAVVTAVTAFTACKKDLTDVNKNPTAITADQYDPNLLLTTVQLMYTGSTDFGAENWYVKWGLVAGFIQHVASTNTSFYPGDKYLNSVGSFGVYFDHSYIYQVQPVVELYELTLNKPQYQNLHQMARIMKALVFERITDLYGDVPYSQAGLGYYQRIYTPVYDKQQDIYADLLKEVSQATDSLSESADKPTGDVFYSAANDQIRKWKKFGNTLLLRMAMRLTNVDPATAQQYVKQVQNQTMQGNNDNAIVQHEDGNNVTQNRDAWSLYGQDSSDIKLCSTYIDFLKKNNDPRLPVVSWIFATEDRNPKDQQGLPPGYIVGGNRPNFDIRNRPDYPAMGMQGYSRLSDIILNNSAPDLILTYAESEFLLADAAKRWGIGNAKPHYNNGVLAAITEWSAFGNAATISEDDAQAYLNAHPYNDANGLNLINTQFWAATLMNEYESWCNWRRTGYPNLTPTNYPGNVTNGTIPRRLAYPPSQKVTNGDNYNKAVANLSGGDKLTSRMWIDPQ
jgi:hypothetical protein